MSEPFGRCRICRVVFRNVEDWKEHSKKTGHLISETMDRVAYDNGVRHGRLESLSEVETEIQNLADEFERKYSKIRMFGGRIHLTTVIADILQFKKKVKSLKESVNTDKDVSGSAVTTDKARVPASSPSEAESSKGTLKGDGKK